MNLSLKDINELSIPLPSKKKQIEIAELFAKIINVISKRKEELKALDDLIKARFVEMFGDPIQNPKGYLKETLINILIYFLAIRLKVNNMLMKELIFVVGLLLCLKK